MAGLVLESGPRTLETLSARAKDRKGSVRPVKGFAAAAAAAAGCLCISSVVVDFGAETAVDTAVDTAADIAVAEQDLRSSGKRGCIQLAAVAGVLAEDKSCSESPCLDRPEDLTAPTGPFAEDTGGRFAPGESGRPFGWETAVVVDYLPKRLAVQTFG